MHSSYDKQSAIVVLPALGRDRVRDPRLRSWLAKSDLNDTGRAPDLLPWILGRLGKPSPTDGLGALRIWGQTGDRPTAWIAAADPVYLEPRLDHLCMHVLGRRTLPPSDLDPLVNHLQRTVADGTPFAFARVRSGVYLSSMSPVATASVSPQAVDGRKPNEFLPQGPGADEHRKLASEIEMALHEHPVNLERNERGLPPINSLWIWGGGHAPDVVSDLHPPLFADDALLKGYWDSKKALAEPWPGDFAGCLDVAESGFVAVAPGVDDTESLEYWLRELKANLGKGRLSSLTILFRDGVVARIRRVHAARIWRRSHDLLEAPNDGA